MKYVPCLAILGWLVTGCSTAEEAEPEARPTPPQAPEAKSPEPLESRSITLVATVESVDPDRRLITLKGPEGRTFSLRVAETQNHMDEIKPGDQVKVDYHRSVALEIVKAGKTVNDRDVVIESVEPGEGIGQSMVRRSTITATVEQIDPMTPSVTLRGPDGEPVTVLVRHPERLEKIQVGDQLRITYSEALAVKVEPAPYSAR